MDLYLELQKKLEYLDQSIKNLSTTCRDYGEAYAKYRIELAKELVLLKDSGMAVTLAYDVARGKHEIARLKYNEICKEGIYKANLESINVAKLQVKILQNQIDKEYGHEEVVS